MSQWIGFQFRAASPDDAERFVVEYVLDAIDRIDQLDDCDSATFAYGADPDTGKRSVVQIACLGAPDTVRDAEESHWNQYIESGVLEEWEQLMAMDMAELEELMGERTAELWPSLAALSTEMAKPAYDLFDTLETEPAAVDTFPEEDSQAPPIGWWSVLHNLTVQLNYTLDEEMDAYLYGIEHTLRNFAEGEGEDAVDERIDDLEAELARMREEVKEGRVVTL